MMNAPASITILADNHAKNGLVSAHGFSAWIEAGESRVLFDTGQFDIMLENAERLGIDLRQAESLVLSHGHNDHSGNMPEFFAMNPKAHLYCGPNIHIDRYCCRPGTEVFCMAAPAEVQQTMQSLPTEQLHELHEPQYLAPGVGITGPIPRLTQFEVIGDALFKDVAGQEIDPVVDDQAMWFETEKGLVILIGCCHAGVVNTINFVRKISGQNKVRGIVGGMHLFMATPQRMADTLKAMAEWKLEFLIPCHCTGDNAINQMIATLGDKTVRRGHVGFKIFLGNLSADITASQSAASPRVYPHAAATSTIDSWTI